MKRKGRRRRSARERMQDWADKMALLAIFVAVLLLACVAASIIAYLERWG